MPDEKCRTCERPTCDGCPLCCCGHPGHTLRWEPWGCPDCNARIEQMMEATA